MASVRELHHQAMHLAFSAKSAHNVKDYSKEKELALLAATLEKQAAEQLNPTPEDEPTRSIILFSAASLAWQAEDMILCRQLCAEGLRGFPSEAYQNDFQDMLDKVTASKHLEIRGKELHPFEIQLSLQGALTIPGFIPIVELSKRMRHISSILIQSARRFAKLPFRSGRTKDHNDTGLVPYAAAVGSGSFTMTVGLAYQKDRQFMLPGFTDTFTPELVIEDFLKNMDFIAQNKWAEISETIEDEAYRTNFIATAKEIAPDGKRINMLGLSNNNKKVLFKTTRRDFSTCHIAGEPCLADDANKLKGLLFAADLEKFNLAIKTEDGIKHKVKAKEGLQDIVRSHFGKTVEANGAMKGKTFIMSSIDPVEDDDF